MEFFLFIGVGIYLAVILIYCVVVSTNILLPLSAVAWTGFAFYSFLLLVHEEFVCKLKTLLKS